MKMRTNNGRDSALGIIFVSLANVAFTLFITCLVVAICIGITVEVGIFVAAQYLCEVAGISPFWSGVISTSSLIPIPALLLVELLRR